MVSPELLALERSSKGAVRAVAKFKIAQVLGSGDLRLPLPTKRTDCIRPLRWIVWVHYVALRIGRDAHAQAGTV